MVPYLRFAISGTTLIASKTLIDNDIVMVDALRHYFLTKWRQGEL